MTLKINNLVLYICLLLVMFGAKAQELQYRLNMVHNNPGEPRTVTKYNNPDFLKTIDITGITPHWQVQCAITYDDFKERIIPDDAVERSWIKAHANFIDVQLNAFEAAGIKVYPFTDFVVLPKSLYEKNKAEISGTGMVHGNGGAADRAKKLSMQSEKLQELLRAQINGIFNRFPKLDGLTLRFGETYLHDTPYHYGGSPIAEGFDGVKDHIVLMNLLREEICVKRNKKLFYRTWDFGHGFHTNPEYYLAVTQNVEPHPNLIISIKHQSGDFHRMTYFNETLGLGNHNQIAEISCQLEAYGKGAHPYYVAGGVINGWPETQFEIQRGTWNFTGNIANPSLKRGLKELISHPAFKGVQLWTRGGGWQGPYVTNEINIDINALVLALWAKQPKKTEEEVFFQAASQLGIVGKEAELFRKINLMTVEAVRKGQLNSFVSNNLWWTRDEFFSIDKAERTVNEILKKDLVQVFLNEKQESVDTWKEIESLSKQFIHKDKKTEKAFKVSCSYGRIKYEIIKETWNILLYEGSALKGDLRSKEIVVNAIKKYESLFKEWNKLYMENPECATIYTELAFKNKIDGSTKQLVNKLKQQLQ